MKTKYEFNIMLAGSKSLVHVAFVMGNVGFYISNKGGLHEVHCEIQLKFIVYSILSAPPY